MSKPSPPKLLVPREVAVEKIKGQIPKGSQILGSLRRDLPHTILGVGWNFEKAEAEREKWAKFTVHLLETLFSDDSIAREFGGSWLHYSDYGDLIDQFEDWMKRRIVRLESIVERLDLFPLAESPVQAKAAPAPSNHQSKDIFIVHGHDEAAKPAVARFIEHLGLHPIILHEQADRGRTIIEKFEHHSDVGFAVVLLTPDDMGHPKDEPPKSNPRARQNVIFELGFFFGMLNCSRVCALLKGDI
jgi:hypothetical protein